MEDSGFWVNFVVGNSKNCKNWVWKEKIVEPSMCYTYIFNKTLVVITFIKTITSVNNV